MKEYLINLLILLNILGGLTLPIYYGEQLTQTSPLLWLFVPDCQLSAFFFATALILIISKKEINWLTQLGIASAIKYGLWTLIVMLINYQYYAEWANMTEYWAIIVSHLILMLEPLIIIDKFKLTKDSIPCFTLLLLNDASDYLLNTRPRFPESFVPYARVFTPIITLSLIGLSYYLTKHSKA